MKRALLVLLFVLLAASPVIAVEQGQSVTVPLDPTILQNMTGNEMAAVIKAAAQAQEKAERSGTTLATMGEVANGMPLLDSEKLKKNADAIGEAVVSFSTKIGMAVKEVLQSETGSSVIKFGLVFYAIKSGMLTNITDIFDWFLSYIVGGGIITTMIFFIWMFNSTKTIKLTHTLNGKGGYVKTSGGIMFAVKEDNTAEAEKEDEEREKVTFQEEVVVSRFTINSDDKDVNSVYTAIASLICAAILCVTTLIVIL